jgi:protein AaeX
MLHELNLDGVYVAPITVPMIIAWITTVVLRRIAALAGWLRFVWHPALFTVALYLIVLAAITLIAQRLAP